MLAHILQSLSLDEGAVKQMRLVMGTLDSLEGLLLSFRVLFPSTEGGLPLKLLHLLLLSNFYNKLLVGMFYTRKKDPSQRFVVQCLISPA
jgi:hypothetical protein